MTMNATMITTMAEAAGTTRLRLAMRTLNVSSAEPNVMILGATVPGTKDRTTGLI